MTTTTTITTAKIVPIAAPTVKNIKKLRSCIIILIYQMDKKSLNIMSYMTKITSVLPET